MKLRRTNVESLRSAIAMYGNKGKCFLIINDEVQKEGSNMVHFEEVEEEVFEVFSGTKSLGRFEDYVQSKVGVEGFVRKYSQMGMTMILADKTEWIQKVVGSEVIDVVRVPEMFAVNVESFAHKVLASVSLKSEYATTVKNVFTITDPFKNVYEVGSVEGVAPSANIRNGMNWSEWIYNSFREVNCRDNLDLSTAYLSALRARRDNSPDYVRLKYMTDYVPVVVKFSGVGFSLLDGDSNELSDCRLFKDNLKVGNSTVNGGSLRTLTNDENIENESYTLYSTKGNFNKTLGVYPKSYGGQLFHVYMSVVYDLIYPTMFTYVNESLYVNGATGDIITEKVYRERFNRGEAMSDYMSKPVLEIYLDRGLKSVDYAKYVSMTNVAADVTRVVRVLQDATYADLMR